MPAENWRKKPVEIQALRWTGSNQAEVADFMGASPAFGTDLEGAAWVEIETLEGVMRANKGDWIIRGVRGEFYPCRDDIFRATYERVEG